MKLPDLAAKIIFWILHFIGWFLFNVVLGSLPFVKILLTQGTGDPFQIGLLCFCFSVVSSGLYTILIGFLKVGDRGFTGTFFTAIMGFTIFWVIGVWTIVLLLPEIILLVSNDSTIKIGLLVLYAISVLLFLIANFTSLSEVVNIQLSKRSIVDPVTSSQSNASAIQKTLDQQGEF